MLRICIYEANQSLLMSRLKWLYKKHSHSIRELMFSKNGSKVDYERINNLWTVNIADSSFLQIWINWQKFLLFMFMMLYESRWEQIFRHHQLILIKLVCWLWILQVQLACLVSKTIIYSSDLNSILNFRFNEIGLIVSDRQIIKKH